MIRNIRLMRAPLRRFAADQRGVSAVEFAILLPLMLTMYLGGVEISQAVSADRKTTLVAHTIGDLTAQASNVTSADMSNVLNAGAAVAYPFPSSNLRETVTAVCINSTGTQASNGALPFSAPIERSSEIKTPSKPMCWRMISSMTL